VQLPGHRRWRLQKVLAARPVPAADGTGHAGSPVRSGVHLPRAVTFSLSAAAVVALLILLAIFAVRAVAAVRTLRIGGAGHRTVEAPGTGLLYTQVQGERTSLRTLSASGSHLQTSASGAVAGIGSPTSSLMLTVASACPRCAPEYQLRDLATGAVRTIGTAPPLAPGDPIQAAWSADGQSIAFVELGLDAPRAQVYLLDLRTDARRPVAPGDPQPQSWPTWSPDSSHVAYLSGTEQTVVNSVDLYSGSIAILNDQLDHASELSWSPDGRFLALLHADAAWLVSTDDGQGIQLGAPGRVLELGGWAPGSRSVVLIVEDFYKENDAGGSVVVAPLGDFSPRVLTTGKQLSSPRWAPDGRSIAWTEAQGGRWTIRSVSSAGGPIAVNSSGEGLVRLDGWR
jgi:Tol biopolymer transport system component